MTAGEGTPRPAGVPDIVIGQGFYWFCAPCNRYEVFETTGAAERDAAAHREDEHDG